MHFEKQSHIDAPPEAVFAFHESPGALARLSPPWEKVKVVEGGESIRVGSRVVLRMSLGPIPLRWVAEHAEYAPPTMFADRQVSGPFARWYHRHLMEPDGQGGTLLRDSIDFDPPLGALGRLLAGRYLLRKLSRTFDYRHQVTKAAVEGGRSAGPTSDR